MKRTFLLTIFFSLFFLIANWAYSQTSISGVINSYTAVDSIYPTKDTIEVVDASAFSINDTVMIYQAKGAKPNINVAILPHNFGNVSKNDFNGAGKYEIILILKIEGNKVIFKATPKNDYDTQERVQLIKVPSYKSAIINDELTCENWDGSTGGVLALMVSDTLLLNANINVVGKGFRGADPFYYDSLSYGSNCASEDSALYESQYFNANTNTISAGYKGEGIAKFDNTYRKGLGRWANGGGAGNGRFAGGGGGGNGAQGGYGGGEDTTICTTPNYSGQYWFGVGGRDGFGLNLIFDSGTTHLINDSTMFFGGGGGSGTTTTTNGFSASTGGNGGGVIIIIAKVIMSTGDSIIADGANVYDIAEASGSGGGAAGSIVFDIDSVIGTVGVYANGGAGGKVQYLKESGPGGGGAGGVLFWNSTEPSNVNAGYDGGKEGVVAGSQERHGAAPGQPGTSKDNYKAPLTGFLFNSITSDQEVCMDGIPEILSGSEPRGGYGDYKFQWEKSSDGSSWLPLIGDTIRDFQPPALTDTIYYRRVVTSGSIIDIGNDIEIIVHDLINKNNIWSFDLVKCIGLEADSIIGDTASFGGNTISYKYIWEYSFDSTNWVTETSTEDTIYKYGIISDTTYIRRRVISGGCNDTTFLSSPIIGLPKIKNIISQDQEICYNDSVVELKNDTVADGLGLGSYTYQWIKSQDGAIWIDTIGAVDSIFQPPPLFNTIYYKRVVFSDDCIDTSNLVSIDVLPLIGNNIITNGLYDTTCYNTPPQLLIGSMPTGGNDPNYTYVWEQRRNLDPWIDTAVTSKDIQPVALTDTTFYRRIVSSSACKDTSEFIKISIWDLPIALISSLNDTICSGEEIILNFSLSSGQLPFIITYNNGYDDFTSASVNVYNPVINPESINESKDYNYSLVSVVDLNACEATEMTGLVPVTVYGNPISNAGIKDENCMLSFQLAAEPSLGTGIWSQVSGVGNTTFENETMNTSTITVDTASVYTYKWKEINWKCPDSAYVEITLYERPFNIRVNHIDTTLFFVQEVELKGTYNYQDTFKVNSVWELNLENGEAEPLGIEIDTINQFVIDSVKLIDLIDRGADYIPVTWTVKKGTCPDTVVNISIKLKELFTPTGFTPNGDGVNDYLTFNGIENSDENELIIYNRWGTEVKRMKNYSNDSGWDGKNNKGYDLPEDTYYYILMVTDEGDTQTHKGFIVIKRY